MTGAVAPLQMDGPLPFYATTAATSVIGSVAFAGHRWFTIGTSANANYQAERRSNLGHVSRALGTTGWCAPRSVRFPAKYRHPTVADAWCSCSKDVEYVEPKEFTAEFKFQQRIG